MKKILVALLLLLTFALVGCGPQTFTAEPPEGCVKVGYFRDSSIGNDWLEFCVIVGADEYNPVEDGDLATVELVYDIALAEYTRGTLTLDLLDELENEIELADDGNGDGSVEFQIALYKASVLLGYLREKLMLE